MNFPDKKYNCILADPPWSYNDRSGRNHEHGASEKYNTMSLDDICNMDINSISEDDCCLFMWATSPLLPEAVKVMESWGFTYKASFFWEKTGLLGMGQWFRNQVEICMVGVKGNVKAFSYQKPNIIKAKAKGHSKKPKEFYSIIENIGFESKIELFARERRQGWDAWGNQLPNSTQMIFA